MLLGAMNAPVLGGPPCSSGLLPAMVDQPDVCCLQQPPTPRGPRSRDDAKATAGGIDPKAVGAWWESV